MSYLLAAPEFLASAAADLSNIGSAVTDATAAAGPTSGLLAAAGDEVSQAVAARFSAHGVSFQALSAQASAFHAQFARALNGAGFTYAVAEATNASPLQTGGGPTDGFISGFGTRASGSSVNGPISGFFNTGVPSATNPAVSGQISGLLNTGNQIAGLFGLSNFFK